MHLKYKGASTSLAQIGQLCCIILPCSLIFFSESTGAQMFRGRGGSADTKTPPSTGAKFSPQRAKEADCENATRKETHVNGQFLLLETKRQLPGKPRLSVQGWVWILRFWREGGDVCGIGNMDCEHRTSWVYRTSHWTRATDMRGSYSASDTFEGFLLDAHCPMLRNQQLSV